MKERQQNIWVRDPAALGKALIQTYHEFHNDFLAQDQSSARTAIYRGTICVTFYFAWFPPLHL